MGSIWVGNDIGGTAREASGKRNTVSRVSLRDRRVVASIRVPNPVDVDIGGRRVWVASATSRRKALVVIDPRTNRVVGRVDLKGATGRPQLAAGANAIWVLAGDERSRSGGGLLFKVSMRTGRVLWAVALPGTTAIAYGAGGVWVVVPTASRRDFAAVLEIDLRMGRTRRRIPLIRGTSAAFGGGVLWIVGANALSRVDPHTGRASFRTVPGLGGGYAAAWGLRSLWFTGVGSSTIFRFIPAP